MAAAEQARVFLAMLMCGAVCGAAYDVLMLLRRAFGSGRIFTGLADVAFGVVAAAGMTATALALRVDPFRLYEFVGIALGFVFYYVSIGMIVRAVYRNVGKLVEKSSKRSGEVPK